MVFRLPSISLFDWHLHLLYMAPAIIEDILALWHMTFQWDLKTIRFFLPSPELVIALRCHCASVDSSAQQPRCMCKACSFLWRPGSSGPFTEQNENHDFLLACTSNFMVSALAVFFWYLHSSLWKNVAPRVFHVSSCVILLCGTIAHTLLYPSIPHPPILVLTPGPPFLPGWASLSCADPVSGWFATEWSLVTKLKSYQVSLLL